MSTALPRLTTLFCFVKLCLASNRIHFPFFNTNPSLSLINCDWGLLRKSPPVPKQNAGKKRKSKIGKRRAFLSDNGAGAKGEKQTGDRSCLYVSQCRIRRELSFGQRTTEPCEEVRAGLRNSF